MAGWLLGLLIGVGGGAMSDAGHKKSETKNAVDDELQHVAETTATQNFFIHMVAVSLSKFSLVSVKV